MSDKHDEQMARKERIEDCSFNQIRQTSNTQPYKEMAKAMIRTSNKRKDKGRKVNDPDNPVTLLRRFKNNPRIARPINQSQYVSMLPGNGIRTRLRRDCGNTLKE